MGKIKRINKATDRRIHLRRSVAFGIYMLKTIEKGLLIYNMVFLILLKRKAGFLPAFLSYAKDICPSADILNEITASDAVFAA